MYFLYFIWIKCIKKNKRNQCKNYEKSPIDRTNSWLQFYKIFVNIWGATKDWKHIQFAILRHFDVKSHISSKCMMWICVDKYQPHDATIRVTMGYLNDASENGMNVLILQRWWKHQRILWTCVVITKHQLIMDMFHCLWLVDISRNYVSVDS